jgi:hypothetical protein
MRRHQEKFFGDWGKIDVVRPNGFGLGFGYHKASVGTRVGDPRKRFHYTVSLDLVLWQVDFIWFRKVNP